jgi:hypothetical protein
VLIKGSHGLDTLEVGFRGSVSFVLYLVVIVCLVVFVVKLVHISRPGIEPRLPLPYAYALLTNRPG